MDLALADNWPPERREQWIRDYLAGRPVNLPMPEHEDGACGHCDALRALMREADERDDRATGGRGADAQPDEEAK